MCALPADKHEHLLNHICLWGVMYRTITILCMGYVFPLLLWVVHFFLADQAKDAHGMHAGSYRSYGYTGRNKARGSKRKLYPTWHVCLTSLCGESAHLTK